jgi:nucleoid DNA-binding protein
MTKTEVVKEVRKRVKGLNHTQIKAVMEAIRKVAVHELRKNQEFLIPGVVRIKIRNTSKRPPRVGRNPLTGGEILIPEKPAGKKLKATFVKALKVEVGQAFKKDTTPSA